MARIRCKNGVEHMHSSTDESRRCWQGPGLVAAAPFAASAPAQVIQVPVPVPVSAPAPTPPAPQRKRSFVTDDPRFKMVEGMIRVIPQGYYATAPQGENRHSDFLRITEMKNKRSRFNGALTIQTQHSDAWSDPKIVFWPSGKTSVYAGGEQALDMVLEVIADYKTCALRYSVLNKRCMRCGKKLTDDRSRHYLVGPECENKYNYVWPVNFADEWNGVSFEQLRHTGKPYNQHHDSLQKS